MKIVGTSLYVHKTALNQLFVKVTENEKNSILERLSLVDTLCFDYTIVKYDKKTKNLSVIYSPDWDIANEPLVGNSLCIHLDGSYKYIKSTNKIYHSKELFVNTDYKGFNIQKAKERTLLWNTIPNIKEHKSKIGNRAYWINLLKTYGIEI